MKKLTMSAKLNAVSAVLSLIGLILAYVTHAMSDGNRLQDPTTMVIVGIVGIVLSVVAIVLSKNDIVTLIAPLGAIACNVAVINTIVADRILMIAGLFSYNSNDTVGWSVFYVVVASAVVLLIAAIATIVGCFLKPAKEVVAE